MMYMYMQDHGMHGCKNNGAHDSLQGQYLGLATTQHPRAGGSLPICMATLTGEVHLNTYIFAE